MATGSGITPIQPSAAKPAPSGQIVQIKSLPDALQTVPRPVRLEGEVVRRNEDGSTRIRTAEGDIDVNIRGKQPQPGMKLEVDVPAGSPPKTATVRPVPPQAQQPPAPPPLPEDAPAPQIPQPPVQTKPAQGQPPPTTPQPAPQNSLPSQPSTLPQTGTLPPQQAPRAPVFDTPEDILKIPSQNQPLPHSLSPEQSPLAPGQTVRLAPLTPAQAQLFIQQGQEKAPDVLKTDISLKPFQATLSLNPAQISSASAAILSDAPDMSLIKNLLGLKPPLQFLPAKIQPQTSINPKNLSLLPLPASLPKLDGIKQFLTDFFSKSSPVAVTNSSQRTTAFLTQADLEILEILPPQAQVTVPQSNGLASKISPADISSFFQPMAGQKTITATVMGFTPQNFPIVAMEKPDGTFSQNLVLQSPAQNISVGSRIIFSVLPNVQTQTVPPAPLMQPYPLWPALDDIYQTLLQAAPELAQAMARTVPSPASPGQMGAAALLFVAAARSGNLDGWLGESKMEALQKIGKGGFLSRLNQDAGNILRANADAPSGEWRSYPLPLLWQNEIARVMLHIKHDPPQSGKEEQEGSTRFVMDLDLTRMGEVQLDGLLRGKRLDLIVRTQLPVSLSMQDALRKAYADALQDTDIYGDIAFQGDFKGWMQVLKKQDRTIAAA
jgi:hypothetical protein